MDQLDTLVGDASARLMEAADKVADPRLAASARRTAQALAARERDEKISAARSTPFARVSVWMVYLPITRRQLMELGRIYSFQCSANKDGSTGEYRMSLANGAAELKIDRTHFKNDLHDLVGRGFLIRRSNGERTPATYLVDEAVCIDEARRNGWDG